MGSKKSRKKKPRKKVKKLSRVQQLERYAKSLEKRLRKYEGKRFIGPLKPGQTYKKPSRTAIDAVRTKLKAFMEGVKRGLEGDQVAAKYRSHENEDGSVDAELRIPLEDAGDIKGTFIEIEDAGDWNSLSDFWVMVGINSSGETVTGSPTLDRRPNRAWTNPVRGNRAGAAFFTARETVVDNLEKYGADFNLIVIRVNWSPTNDRLYRPR